MMGIDRKAARYTWTAAAVILLLWLVYLVRSTLFIFVLALLFAYLLAPLVDLLDRSLPARRTRTRTPALALAYLIFLAIVVVAGAQIIPRVVQEATALKEKFPKMVASWEQQPAPGSISSIKDQVLDRVRTEVAQRSSNLIDALPQLGLRFLSVASDLIFVVIIP